MKVNDKKFTDQRFYWLFFLFILGIAVILRLPYLSVERLWPDEALYAWAAKRIFLHPELIFSKEIVDFHPPLFSLLLSFGHFFFSGQLACHVVVFLINILGIAAIYFLGAKINGRFLGSFAAMALSFSLLYFEMSSCILIDGALVVFTILFFYVLAGVSLKKITRQDFYLGFAAMALILLKWSGGLMLPFLFCYYLLAFPEITFRERLTKAAVPLTFCAVLVGILLWHNHEILGSWLPKVFDASTSRYLRPFFFYYDQFLNNIVSASFLPFFIFGLWNMLKSSDRNCWVHGFWVVFVFLVISIMPTKDMRFMMPFIPSCILVTGMGLDAVLTKVEKITALSFLRPICLLVIGGFCIFSQYPTIEKYITLKSYGYVGYRAAGAYLKKEFAGSPDMSIFASSPRMIRYYTDINFKEFGGNISYLPESEDEFIRMIKNSSSNIVLVLDIWEWAQPKWIYPLEERHLKLFSDLGFKLERVINRDVLLKDNSFEKKAVVLIFRRHGKGL